MVVSSLARTEKGGDLEEPDDLVNITPSLDGRGFGNFSDLRERILIHPFTRVVIYGNGDLSELRREIGEYNNLRYIEI
jgi:hypothetical protein